jgi:hypothetical protein
VRWEDDTDWSSHPVVACLVAGQSRGGVESADAIRGERRWREREDTLEAGGLWRGSCGVVVLWEAVSNHDKEPVRAYSSSHATICSTLELSSAVLVMVCIVACSAVMT